MTQSHRQLMIALKVKQLTRVRLANSAAVRAERQLLLAQKVGVIRSLDFEGLRRSQLATNERN